MCWRERPSRRTPFGMSYWHSPSSYQSILSIRSHESSLHSLLHHAACNFLSFLPDIPPLFKNGTRAKGYEHLFTFSNYRYFQSLTEKEGDSSLLRLATSDSLVLKNVRFFAKRYRTKYTVDFADS